jgi:hypothetical protein
LRLQHGTADDVFRRDQLDLVALAAEFAGNRARDLGIGLVKSRGKEPPPRPLRSVAGGRLWAVKRVFADTILPGYGQVLAVQA